MYRERPPRPELRGHLACVWFERAGDRDHALPDGFVDLVFGRSLWVRGPDTRRHGIRTVPGSSFVGVRFRPGAAPFVLGVPASDLTDSRVFLRDLWGRFADELAERMAGERDPAALLEAAVARRARSTDIAVDAVVGHLQRGGSSAGLAELVGLSERQLRRRTVSALGYGAKTLERILRFQRFLTLVGSRPLAQVASLAGYADQAHLTRECRRLAGTTPRALAA